MFLVNNLLQLAVIVALAGCTSQPDATAPPTTRATAPPPTLARAAAATARYAGAYRWRDADNPEMGGTLAVYPESDSTILFYLESNDGAPTYHMANVFGRAHLRGDTATYFSKAAEDAHGCRLKIGFAPAAARVLMVSGTENDCFFGGSFTPAGLYQRTSHPAASNQRRQRHPALCPPASRRAQRQPLSQVNAPFQPGLTCYFGPFKYPAAPSPCCRNSACC